MRPNAVHPASIQSRPTCASPNRLFHFEASGRQNRSGLVRHIDSPVSRPDRSAAPGARRGNLELERVFKNVLIVEVPHMFDGGRNGIGAELCPAVNAADRRFEFFVFAWSEAPIFWRSIIPLAAGGQHSRPTEHTQKLRAPGIGRFWTRSAWGEHSSHWVIPILRSLPRAFSV